MQNVREAITNLLMNGVDRAYDTDLAAALLRSGAATVPKAPERNWDALIEAARRKPRTDDDVLREKFGGGAVS